MDVREKLVQLLKDIMQLFTFEEQVDHLIAHGVTVQEWVSVDDRLPEVRGYYLVAVKHFTNGNMETRYEFWNGGGWLSRYKLGDPMVTHWMPLPQPPKGGAV